MHSVASLPFRRLDETRPTLRTARSTSFTFPDRLKDEAEDIDVDVAAPRSKRGEYVNQSFLSMIANVGSSVSPEPHVGLQGDAQQLESSMLLQSPSTMSHDVAEHGIPPVSRAPDSEPSEQSSEQSNPRLSESTQTFKSKPRRAKRSNRSRLAPVVEDMSSSQILQPLTRTKEYGSSEDTGIPKVDEAIPELSEDASFDENASSSSSSSSSYPSEDSVHGLTPLAAKVAQVYGFNEVEQIVSEFPCWLVQNIVVQGRLYITTKHVCFYAFLPKKTGTNSKSGFLHKRGPRNPRYHRYWFVLKDNVISYYKSASDLYFPQGTVDLRSALSAHLEEASDDGSGRAFSITTSQRTLRFKAESVTSAQEWVKKIQRAIFHSHNASNTMRVCLPIGNMLDIEENPMFERWNTLKIKIVDNDETFAIDEYFFSFLNQDYEALNFLKENVMNRPSVEPGARVDDQEPSLMRRSFSDPEPVVSMRGSKCENLKNNKSPPSARHTNISSQAQFDNTSSSSSRTLSRIPSEHTASVSAFKSWQGTDREISPSRTMPTSQKEVETSGQPHTPFDVSLGFEDTSAEKRESMEDPACDSVVGETEGSTITAHPSLSSARLETLMRASEVSFQKASGVAGVFRETSKRMGNVLAHESKLYYEKVTNMWSGRTIHFDRPEEPFRTSSESREHACDSTHNERFRMHFSLSEKERLKATYHGFLLSGVPVYGKFYLSDRKLCFRNLIPGTRTKMILPLRDIITIDKAKGFNLGYHGLVIIVSGHEELFLEFARTEARDDLAVSLQKGLGNVNAIADSRVMDESEQKDFEVAKSEYEALEQARNRKRTTSDSMFESIAIDDDEENSVVIFDDMDASIVDFKPPKSLRIVCLTIGSRGDVQPYIALCKGLLAEGHRPLIATHAEFEEWIRKHDIDFAPVAGNPAEIMQLCVENDTFTVNFFREVASKMRPWFDALLATSWKACQGADVLIESPSAMAGVHIAQALQIPYFRAFSMMWTRTRAYPHPFVVPKQKLGGNYNYLSYVIVDKFLWQASAYQINKWRTQTLGLPTTGLERLKLNSVPFLYNFSPSLVARPLDFSPWIHVTGNWFLNESDGWQPPPALDAFIAKARSDGKKLVYVGFGSMVVENRAAMTKTIVDSVLKADVRCVFSKGWSDRLERPYDSAEIMIPGELMVIKSAPHDWLFEKIDAAVHHGGAGTTAASLRAGVPTIVRPFFGDQKFYGARVEDLGVGRCLDKFNTSSFSRALWEATHNERVIEKARTLGERIRAEDGVTIAIQSIYRDLEYAKSLVKHQTDRTDIPDEADDDSVQDWTMVDDDFDE